MYIYTQVLLLSRFLDILYCTCGTYVAGYGEDGTQHGRQGGVGPMNGVMVILFLDLYTEVTMPTCSFVGGSKRTTPHKLAFFLNFKENGEGGL